MAGVEGQGPFLPAALYQVSCRLLGCNYHREGPQIYPEFVPSQYPVATIIRSRGPGRTFTCLTGAGWGGVGGVLGRGVRGKGGVRHPSLCGRGEGRGLGAAGSGCRWWRPR